MQTKVGAAYVVLLSCFRRLSPSEKAVCLKSVGIAVPDDLHDDDGWSPAIEDAVNAAIDRGVARELFAAIQDCSEQASRIPNPFKSTSNTPTAR